MNLSSAKCLNEQFRLESSVTDEPKKMCKEQAKKYYKFIFNGFHIRQ
jgi:hypothetical protein